VSPLLQASTPISAIVPLSIEENSPTNTKNMPYHLTTWGSINLSINIKNWFDSGSLPPCYMAMVQSGGIPLTVIAIHWGIPQVEKTRSSVVVYTPTWDDVYVFFGSLL
jgi:hypothetical protein